jgi:hypothetical protein
MSTKVKPLRRGLVKPRLHTPLLKGKSRIDEVSDLADKIAVLPVTLVFDHEEALTKFLKSRLI